MGWGCSMRAVSTWYTGVGRAPKYQFQPLPIYFCKKKLDIDPEAFTKVVLSKFKIQYKDVQKTLYKVIGVN